MGLFDFFFKKGLPAIGSPDQLKTVLFDAALAGDGKRLSQLCRANQEAIEQYFPQWQKVPEEIRNDYPRVQRYVHCLVTVAEFFNDALGSPQLMQRLIGPEESNPLLQWQKKLRAAEALIEQLRYREAAQDLAEVLIDVSKLQGSGVDTYLPITYGYLGQCYFHGGEVQKAIAPVQRALELCEQQGDGEGVLTYLGNLYEIHRYLGQSQEAANFAGRLAEAFAQHGRGPEATRYRKQAVRVRDGEPRNRVVAVVNEQRFELDELPTIKDGRVQFAFERNRVTLQPAAILTSRGEKLAGEGQFDSALALFREAAQADPYDPHSRFLAGFTLLHLRRYGEAVESYQETEELAPGWFQCRADLWLAQELMLGKLEHQTFLALCLLQDGPQGPKEKVQLAQRALAEAPDLALLHLYHGKNLANLGRNVEGETAYRKGLACAVEPDVKTRLLVELGVTVSSPEEKTNLLQEATRLNGNLVAAATAALVLKR
jgi:tetratricopeptide (TPR) repeat protein